MSTNILLLFEGYTKLHRNIFTDKDIWNIIVSLYTLRQQDMVEI